MAGKKTARKSASKSTKAKNGENGGDSKLAREDGQHDAISAGRAAGGTGTASGQEANRRAGNETVPEGEDRGSKVDPGEVPGETGDYVGEAHPPVGPQLEPAVFVPNGAIPNNMVASPSGLVPVSAVASTPEEAQDIMDKRKEALSNEYKGLTRGKRLTDEQIRTMKGADLRAVAHDRGYDISHNAGTRGTRAAFSELQKKDENLEDAE